MNPVQFNETQQRKLNEYFEGFKEQSEAWQKRIIDVFERCSGSCDNEDRRELMWKVFACGALEGMMTFEKITEDTIADMLFVKIYPNEPDKNSPKYGLN